MKEILATPRGVALIQGEKVVRMMRTHPKYLFMPVAVTILAIFVSVLTAVYVPEKWNELPLRLVSYCLIGLFWLIATSKRLFTWFSRKYVVTTRQVVKLTGIIWVQGHATKIERISDISAQQGLLDRLFGCGTLHLINSSAGSQSVSPQVTLHDVPNVNRVHQQIEELSEALRQPVPGYQTWAVPPQGERPPEISEAEQSDNRPTRWGISDRG
ncbi:PH domain-containing protein [Glutamicibacter ardleyensis]|uniref:PH domain-containing protein n=1 Tax=Glutamicibacter ardleyensis TaxID=225894 RepID=UPI003FD18C73